MTKTTANSYSRFERRALSPSRVSRADLVTERFHNPDFQFLLIVEACSDQVCLRDWMTSNHAHLQEALVKHGGILLRNFEISTPEAFSEAVTAFSPNRLDYLERAAPRHQVIDKVFTSTEFAADQWIPLHHEMSYSHNWPQRIYFYCDVAPTHQGRTPLADERRVTRRIAPEIKERFLAHGVMYVRNYSPEIDFSWQEAFQTNDPLAVEAYCRSNHMTWKWIDQDHLRTEQVRQAMVEHPETGEQLWFNHAHLFHISNMDSSLAASLLNSFGEEGLPRNAYYGDGKPIEPEVLEHIREAYAAEMTVFNWQRGDILILDNFNTVHGREPFSGSRRILVAMTDLFVHLLT
jgi:alpha-ketoglutarate-dependent taurine dioxygenase